MPGHILRWHFDRMREMYSEIDADRAETIILHGDFAPWNILYERGELSGIYDFELAHLNFRVSDFALSWRGYQGDVIAGYMERYPLSELDQKMIVPTFWSWLFKGVKDEIVNWERKISAPPNFEWQIKKLLVRSARYPADRYPEAQL